MLMALFCSLVGIFGLIVGIMTIPVLREWIGFPLVAVPVIAFFVLGLALVFFTRKRKVKGKLKKFLMLTGVSSAGFFVSILLHNFLYGLAVITARITILHYLMEALHGLFFIVGIIVCPIGFLIGVVGTIVLFVKGKRSK